MTSFKRKAIFGGRFDPIHVGHLEVATLAMMTGLVDEVVFVPTADPPHKQVFTPFEHRYEMVRIAIEGISYFSIADWEKHQRYTIYTWQRYANHEDWYLLGSDSFNTVLMWYRYEDVVKNINFMIVPRPLITIRRDLLSVVKRFYITHQCYIAVSSTEIRRRIRKGLSLRGLVFDNVIDYIYKNHLYGGESVGRKTNS